MVSEFSRFISISYWNSYQSDFASHARFACATNAYAFETACRERLCRCNVEDAASALFLHVPVKVFVGFEIDAGVAGQRKFSKMGDMCILLLGGSSWMSAFYMVRNHLWTYGKCQACRKSATRCLAAGYKADGRNTSSLTSVGEIARWTKRHLSKVRR